MLAQLCPARSMLAELSATRLSPGPVLDRQRSLPDPERACGKRRVVEHSTPHILLRSIGHARSDRAGSVRTHRGAIHWRLWATPRGAQAIVSIGRFGVTGPSETEAGAVSEPLHVGLVARLVVGLVEWAAAGARPSRGLLPRDPSLDPLQLRDELSSGSPRTERYT